MDDSAVSIARESLAKVVAQSQRAYRARLGQPILSNAVMELATEAGAIADGILGWLEVEGYVITRGDGACRPKRRRRGSCSYLTVYRA